MSNILTIGEPMGLLVADEKGNLKDVSHFHRLVSGAEVNVSVGVTRLGHKMTYLSQVGKDPFGQHIMDFLEKEKIDTSHVEVSEQFPTGIQLKSKDDTKDPEIFYFRKGSAASKMDLSLIDTVDFSDIDLFHVTGILMAVAENTFELVKALIKKAKANGTIVTFDPNLRPTLWGSKEIMIQKINEISEMVDYILPGISEGEILTQQTGIKNVAEFYLAKGLKGVVIKDGPKGANYYWKEGEMTKEVRVAGFKVEKVVDTVGAGDGFAVGIITGLLENLSPEKMVERANAIGAIQVASISDNDNLPTRDELTNYIQTHR